MATVEHKHDQDQRADNAQTADAGRTLEQRRGAIAQAIEQAPQGRHAQERATQEEAARQLLDKTLPVDRTQVTEMLDRRLERLEQMQQRELELGRQALEQSAQLAQPGDALRSLEAAVQRIGELHAAEQSRFALERDQLDEALAVTDDMERGRQLDQLERDQAQTADELLAIIRNQEPERDSVRAGWDHDRFPEGVGRNWQVGDPIDLPTKDGRSADYDRQKVGKRYWQNAADVELQLRADGKAQQETPQAGREIYQPLRALDDARLEQLRRDGVLKDVGLQGYELEHSRIPQRAATMFEDAGIPADEARRLAHTADPANLVAMDQAMHAANDREAANKTTRNEPLKEAVVAQERGERVTPEPDEQTRRQLADATLRGDLEAVARLSEAYTSAVVMDDRTREEPLRSMTDKEFAALERAAEAHHVATRAKEAATERERANAQKLLDAMEDWRARRRNDDAKRPVQS